MKDLDEMTNEIKGEIGGWVSEGDDPIELDNLARYLAKLKRRIIKLENWKQNKLKEIKETR